VYEKLQGLATDVFFLPYPMDDVKRENLELIYQLSRNVIYPKSKFTFPFVLYSRLAKEKKAHRVHLTPPGGVSPSTILGFVNAALELQAQYEQGGFPMPDYIVCPLGSGGTVAGLSMGLTLIGWPTKVIAVRVVDFIVANRVTLNLLIRKSVKLLRKNGVAVSPAKSWGANVQINHRYFGKGYSQPTELGEKSIELFKKHESQLLDSTYTGKAFAPMIDWAGKGEFNKKHILFWQTLNSRDLHKIPSLLP
ncbi:MAG: pyridoxal-phosphate dependent enzyme, partial [bacterium]